MVVGVANVGGRDKELERIVLVDVQLAGLDLFLQLLHLLLAVAGETQLLLVAPEHCAQEQHVSTTQR